MCLVFVWYGVDPATGYPPTFLLAFLSGVIPGFYACCNSDTWASELGILSKVKPISIVTWREVPPGTNGGVSSMGLLAGLGGSLCIARVAAFVQCLYGELPFAGVLLRCCAITVSGIVGNLLDSVLGATLQYSGFDTVQKRVVRKPGPNVQHISGKDVLSNGVVNLITGTVAGILNGVFTLVLFGSGL